MTQSDDAALPPEIWDRVVDESLPAGVVAFQDGEGRWWRYPVAEFVDDEPPSQKPEPSPDVDGR